MKLWTLVTSSAAFLLILSGCGASPKPKDEVALDETLPTVTLTQTGVFVDMNAIAFEWKSIEDERVEGIYIYKLTMDNEKDEEANELTHYKTIANRFTTHYVDRKVKPDTSYTYSFKTYSKDSESKMSAARVVNSLPVLQSVAWIQSIQNMPRSSKIIWRPHTNEKVKYYIVERRTLEDSEWSEIAKVKGRLSAEYIDLKLKDNFVYKYRVKVVTFDGITSSPSEIVQVVTKPLPVSIENITTTIDLPRKIEINWKKSTTEDFTRYHLYRAEKSDDSYELIAKLYNNTFTDVIEEDAKEYFYRVSAIDKDGLESIHDKLSIQGITLAKPNPPALVSVRLVNSKVEIKWNNKDPRAKKFVVLKKTKTGWLSSKEEEFTNISGETFIDAEVGPDIVYYYKVFAVDEFSIKSEASIEIEIKTPSTLADNSKKEVHKTSTGTNRQKSKTVGSPETVSEEVTIIPVQDFN